MDYVNIILSEEEKNALSNLSLHTLSIILHALSVTESEGRQYDSAHFENERVLAEVIEDLIKDKEST